MRASERAQFASCSLSQLTMATGLTLLESLRAVPLGYKHFDSDARVK